MRKVNLRMLPVGLLMDSVLEGRSLVFRVYRGLRNLLSVSKDPDCDLCGVGGQSVVYRA